MRNRGFRRIEQSFSSAYVNFSEPSIELGDVIRPLCATVHAQDRIALNQCTLRSGAHWDKTIALLPIHSFPPTSPPPTTAMSRPRSSNVFDPLLLFQDKTKTLGHLIKNFRDVYKHMSIVMKDLDTLELYYDTTQPIHLPTILPAVDLYRLSTGLLTLGNGVVTLERLIFKGAAGLQGYDLLLDGTFAKLRGALEHQQRALDRAKTASAQTGESSDIRIVTAFMKALFPE